MRERMTFFRTLVLISYFSLLLTLMLNTTWLSPPEKLPIALVLIFFVLPLLFPLKGILNGISYTHIWTSFLALFYFGHAISQFPEPSHFLSALLQSLFSLSLFVFCLLFAHYKQKQQKIQNETDEMLRNDSKN